MGNNGIYSSFYPNTEYTTSQYKMLCYKNMFFNTKSVWKMPIRGKNDRLIP